MIPFAVTIEGVTKEGQGQWVLAVTKDELLTATADGELVWYPLNQCKFQKLIPPDAPKPVMIVQPQPRNGIALPNRQLRRHPDV